MKTFMKHVKCIALGFFIIVGLAVVCGWPLFTAFATGNPVWLLVYALIPVGGLCWHVGSLMLDEDYRRVN